MKLFYDLLFGAEECEDQLTTLLAAQRLIVLLHWPNLIPRVDHFSMFKSLHVHFS